ncbi:MAG: phosphoribosylanthranilate isomerase [Gammaproteobacteria bacterium]|nr:phosphoribosylanthranilate isomerase [Gammaproteobacteria bacterium]
MARTRIKICGITRPEDGIHAARLGADAIGLVFYPPSPRAVTLKRAEEILARLPPFISTVALFVNPEVEEVERVLLQLAIDLLQFHGGESEPFCRQFSRPYIKALGVGSGEGLAQEMARYPSARGVLLDTAVQGVAGGSGVTFDWQLIPPPLRQSITLAGGLSPQNVAAAVRAVRPYAVDVSSGVEAAKGVKDFDRIAHFIQQVGEADARQ